jgi:Uma2 family endonuclease
MSTPTPPSTMPPTLADLDALPPGTVGEIIEGVLHTMLKPGAQHQRTVRVIGGQVGDWFDNGLGEPGRWWIVTGPGIELPNTPEISPDVAGWRRERMPRTAGRRAGLCGAGLDVRDRVEDHAAS